MRFQIVVALLLVAVLLSGCGLLQGTKLAPDAAIEADPTQGHAPLEVRFSGAPSSDVYGAVTGYAWAFGDGTSGSGMIATHTYLRPGTYVVSLEVTNSLGLRDSERVTVFVKEAPPPPEPPQPPGTPGEQRDTAENALLIATRTLPERVDADGLLQVEVTVEAKTDLALVAFVETPAGLILEDGVLREFRQSLPEGERFTLRYTLRDHDGGGGSIAGTVRAKPPDGQSLSVELASSVAAAEAEAP